jgi:hypothetical protein
MKSNKIFLATAIGMALALFVGLAKWSQISPVEKQDSQVKFDPQDLIKPHNLTCPEFSDHFQLESSSVSLVT